MSRARPDGEALGCTIATALNNGLSDHTITQTGLRNHAVTNQYDVSMSTLSIVQAGLSL